MSEAQHKDQRLHFDCIRPYGPPWGVETVSRRAAQDRDGRCSHSVQKPQWVVCAVRREASQGQTQGRVCVREVSGVGKVKASSRGQSAWRRGLQEGGGSALALCDGGKGPLRDGWARGGRGEPWRAKGSFSLVVVILCIVRNSLP